MMKTSIVDMIEQLNRTMLPWARPDQAGCLCFVDPLDNKEISAHYGATHAAAAWIIDGQRTKDHILIDKGITLLKSILERWSASTKLPGFHFDFNNFALCVAYEYLQNTDAELSEKIKQIVLETPDSNNPTINWYPMRWYVNRMRYQWTGEKRYREVCEKCHKGIQNATFKDGFIDDRVPKGKSFNLQYDVATVAVMQFLRTRGENLDISKEIGALLNAISPDGDINYLGRGTNQVFAWGMWIYLLASSGESEAETAVEYLKTKLPVMLDNNSIMLNNWPGEEKYLWWDYHYCSVYTAHLLFWLVLSLEDEAKLGVKCQIQDPKDSGLRIHRTAEFSVVTFEGRSEYLTERGPAVAMIWTKKNGMVVKGCFAPWQGPFGNDYTFADIALRNYCGLLEVKQNVDYSKNRYLHKMLPSLQSIELETVKPFFVPIDVKKQNKALEIHWNLKSTSTFVVNIPTLTEVELMCSVDGTQVKLFNTMKIRNQYDWVDVWQSRTVSGKHIVLKIID